MSLLQTQKHRIRSGNDILLSVDALSFQPCTLTAIIGPNGAGKSTLIKALRGDFNNENHVWVRLFSNDGKYI
jgi:ABC-type hemin transport system ATPase subunit